MEAGDATTASADDSLETKYQKYVNTLLQKGISPADIPTYEDYKLKVSPDEKILPNYTPPQAASVIQKAWRRHIDVQVYRYYRDLINFRQKGDPSLMLRCINPKECTLLDPAAGTHVKFRLAGDKFPPNIYYKIFTHRPVQDLCANSPKDYTKALELAARQKHNKASTQIHVVNRSSSENTHSAHSKATSPASSKYTGQLVRSGDEMSKEGWYKRTENNGWRLVSDRMLAHMLTDPVTWETSKKTIDFHHDKLQRRQDVERRRKQRKLDWLRKMYQEGLVKSKVSDPDTSALVSGAARGMLEAVEEFGPDAVRDWEVDELLEWTTGLNFDEYLTSWKELATTAGSETKIDAKLQMYQLLEEDVYTDEVPMPASNARSHNTPISNLSTTNLHSVNT